MKENRREEINRLTEEFTAKLAEMGLAFGWPPHECHRLVQQFRKRLEADVHHDDEPNETA